MSNIAKFGVQRDVAGSFSYYNSQDMIYSNQYGANQLNFMETDSSYQWKIGLIAQKAALYIFTIPDVPGVYRKGSVNCGVGTFLAMMKVFTLRS